MTKPPQHILQRANLRTWSIFADTYRSSPNYSAALNLLGINGTYGFQLSLTPDVTVSDYTKIKLVHP